jgi:hypothetical protein
MAIRADFTAIQTHARNNGWQRGDPLRAFAFPEAPPNGHQGYVAMLRRWRDEAAVARRGEAADYYQRLYAASYVLAVYSLRVGSLDGQPLAPEELTVGWLGGVGLPYPGAVNAPHYQHLYHGLRSFWGHRIPRNNRGHMCLTGIGRESGYYSVRYAEALRDRVLVRLGRDWQRLLTEQPYVVGLLERERLVPSTQIPCDAGQQRDYAVIARFFAGLAELRLNGRLEVGSVVDVADHLGLCEAIARRVIDVFVPPAGAGDEPTADLLRITMDANRGVTLSLPNRVRFALPPDASESDVYLAVVRAGDTGKAASHKFRYQNQAWVHEGATPMAEAVNERRSIQVLRVYRTVSQDGSSAVRNDVTPEILQRPLAIFDGRGKPLACRFSQLIAGQTYRLFRTGTWEDSFGVWVLRSAGNDQQLPPDAVDATPDTDAVAVVVRDGAGNDIEEFRCRQDAAISFSFADEHLASYVPGKRCFVSPPVVSDASVGAVEELLISQNGANLFQSQGDGDFFGLPIDLGQIWPDDVRGPVYGQFDLTLRMGTRRGTRRFALLPQDFDHDLDQVHPVIAAAAVTFQSEFLVPDAELRVEILPSQDRLAVELAFQSGWRLPIRCQVRREGAYVETPGEDPVALAEHAAPVSNLDDAVDQSILVVAGPPRWLASIRVSNHVGRADPNAPAAGTRLGVRECVGELLREDGYLRYPFSLLARDVRYDRLLLCDELTVMARMPGQHDRRLGRAALTQFSAEQPDLAVEDGALSLTHPVSPAGLAPSPFIVLLPVGDQGIVRPLAIAEPGRVIPDWCRRVDAGLGIVLPVPGAQGVVLTVPGWPIVTGVASPGYIGFIMGGPAESPRRLSAGFFIHGNDDAPMNDWTQAFYDRDLPRIEALVGRESNEVRDYLEGIYLNAKRLDAFHFLNSFHALAPDVPTGYAFRATWYWFTLVVREWMLTTIPGGQLDMPVAGRLSLLRSLWDEELFGYAEAMTVGTPYGKILQNALALRLQDQAAPASNAFASWPLSLFWLASPGAPSYLADLKKKSLLLCGRAKRLLDGGGEGGTEGVFGAWSRYLTALASRYAGGNLAWAEVRNNCLWEVAELPDIPGFPLPETDFDRYLCRLGYRLHRWRMAPSISIESTRLRDELRWLGEFMPAMKSLAVVWGLVYAWHDAEFQTLRG